MPQVTVTLRAFHPKPMLKSTDAVKFQGTVSNISIKWGKDLTGFERAALFHQGA